MLRMELSEGGMVQLMPADFEVPFFTVEGMGRVIIEAAYGLDNRRCVVYRCVEAGGVAFSDFRPAFMQAALVEEHDCELSNVMLFDIARGSCAASSQQREC